MKGCLLLFVTSIVKPIAGCALFNVARKAIAVGVEDICLIADMSPCRELTNDDRSLRSITNCCQFGDLLQIGYIGQPLCSRVCLFAVA